MRSQRVLKSWATKCGTQWGSPSCGLQLVRKNSNLVCSRERLAEEASSVVASHPVGARSPMRLAALGAMCRSTMQPFRALCLPAFQHDRGMQAILATLLEGIPGDASQQRVASQLVTSCQHGPDEIDDSRHAVLKQSREDQLAQLNFHQKTRTMLNKNGQNFGWGKTRTS